MNFYFFRFLIFFCDDFVKRFKVSLPTVLVLVKPVTKTDIGLCICFGRTLLFLCFFLCSECENISKPLRRFFRKNACCISKKYFFHIFRKREKNKKFLNVGSDQSRTASQRKLKIITEKEKNLLYRFRTDSVTQYQFCTCRYKIDVG